MLTEFYFEIQYFIILTKKLQSHFFIVTETLHSDKSDSNQCYSLSRSAIGHCSHSSVVSFTAWMFSTSDGLLAKMMMPCKASLQLPHIPTTARWRSEWLISASGRIVPCTFLLGIKLAVPSRVRPGRSRRTKTTLVPVPSGAPYGSQLGLSGHVGWDDATATVGKIKEVIKK